MSITSLFIVAFLGEAIWETLKMTWQEGKASKDRIGALIVGLLIAFVTGADILDLVGLPATVPYVGIILTGILISRGANFVHDIITAINGVSGPMYMVQEHPPKKTAPIGTITEFRD